MKMTILKIRFSVVLITIGFFASSYAAEQKPQSGQNEIMGKSRTLQKQFIMNDIIPLQTEETTVNMIGLQQIIDEMQKLQMPPLDEVKVENNEAATPDDQSVKAQSPSEIMSPANMIPDKSQLKETGNDFKQIFAKLLENPEEIVDPLSAAKSLFLNEKMTNAAKFYQIALQRTTKTDNAQDRQWILFQLGNCLRKDDPDRAHDYYSQLIEEYPNSGWTTAARTCQQVIAWYKQNPPSVILEKSTSDPNSI